MKLKVQNQITVVPPPLSLLFFDNGGGQGGGRMLALQKSLKSTHNPQEADRLTREVESVDKAIDNLVYELYGLSPDEINIVEGKKSQRG